MTNLEMPKWGLKHIAENHGFKTNMDEFENGEDHNPCIYGGYNVPTQCDVEMLCADCGVPKSFMDSGEFGFDVHLPGHDEQSFHAWADTEYKKPVYEFWRRVL